MMIMAKLTVALALLATTLAVADTTPHSSVASWKAILRQQLPILGHRNWVVIADSAYPAQTSPGIMTVETNTGQIEVVKEVLKQLGSSVHVAPIIYTDKELNTLNDKLVPGIDKYKNDLAKVLKGRSVQGVLHGDLIAKLDESGKTFKVLILKTNMAMPYTSVFLNLDCKYWGPAKEKKLRDLMKH